MPVLQTIQYILFGGLRSNHRRRHQEGDVIPRLQSDTQMAGMFNGAHGFTIHGGNFTNIGNTLTEEQVDKITKKIVRGESAIVILQEKRTAGAEIDSSQRYPPPRCHPFTRRQLRGRIMEWREETSREMNMFWLLGPAGVGKSAVAQTVGEEYKAMKRPFASFFFSRPNRRDDPTSVIPTLVLQLVAHIPRYKRLIDECFATDPNLLEKDIHTQFKTLLVDPFRTLHSQEPFENPILIIIDGLDECKSKEAQCQFINLISDHVRLRTNSPLLWLVCSRPEWHLKRMLSDADFGVQCRRDEISVDDDEARADVLLVLRDELEHIRRRFHDRFPQSWPGEAAINTLAEGCSNLFIVVTTITRFIGDEKRADPAGRLQACLAFMENQAAASTPNLFGALDLLYKQILTDLDPIDLPIVMSILCLRVLYPGSDLCASLHANVLGLDEATFYRALNGMHSILLIPPLDYAHEYGIQFYHASFQDFLNTRSRTQEFTQAWNTAYCDVTIACLRWLNPLVSAECNKESSKPCDLPLPPLSWLPIDDTPTARVIDQINDIVAITTWEASCQILRSDTSSVAVALSAFEKFDFCHLSVSIRNEGKLVPFLNWLHDVDLSGIILRRIPASVSEAKLALKVSIKVSGIFPLNPNHCRLEFISTHKQKKPTKRDHSAAFLMGTSERSCLVRIHPERGSDVGNFRNLTIRERVDTSLHLKFKLF